METWKTLSARQHGLIARWQLKRLGLTPDAIKNLLRNETLESTLPGVYRLNGTKRTWRQRLAEAVLWGGPGAVAC